MMKTIRRLGAAALVGSLVAQPVAAHSWVDRIMHIAANGTMVGTPGYIRGYVSRDTPGYNDDMDTYLLPPNGRKEGKVLFASDNLCHDGQTQANYSSSFPKLSASAGDFIALRYQENGHVTLPDVNPLKPLNRGTIYIYGTTEPSTSEKFADVFNTWTADGTGGNGKGRLLATRNFDDGQCYQINSGSISTTRQSSFKKTAEVPQGADLWCQNDIQLPSDIASGQDYTLYWVWSWPSMNKAGSPTDVPGNGYNITELQYYTSCMDISITGSNSTAASKLTTNAAAAFTKDQDLNNAAVLSQLTVGAFQVQVPGINATNGTGSPSGSASTSRATTSATVTTQPKSGLQTITVTVTESKAPVTVTVSNAPVTVTVSKGYSATSALSTAKTTSPTTLVTSTRSSAGVAHGSKTTSARATTSASTSAVTSSTSATKSAAAGTAVFPPGQALKPSPFQRVRRVERVRRHL